MSERRKQFYKGLFLVATIYDGILGIVFLFFNKQAYDLLGVPDALPAFSGYILLIGAFLFVIGVAYLLIYLSDMQRNRDLITIGALYKLAYSSIAFYCLAIGDYPHIIFITLFGVTDLIFFVLMIECRFYLGKIGL